MFSYKLYTSSVRREHTGSSISCDAKTRMKLTTQLEAGFPRLLSEVAYERIKESIRTAEIQPGQPLSEKKLSSLLGISRTPIRQAIQQLAQEGLVQIIPGRAVTVASLSVQEVMDAVRVRSILEPELVRLAAISIPPDGLETLRATILVMETAIENDDQAAWVEADRRFHDILSTYCTNRLLGEIVLQVRTRISYLSITSHTDHDRMLACTTEHREVYDAIAARDPFSAEQKMRDHLSKLQDSFFYRLTHF